MKKQNKEESVTYYKQSEQEISVQERTRCYYAKSVLKKIHNTFGLVLKNIQRSENS